MRATPCMTKYTKIRKQVRVRAFVFRIRDQVQSDMFWTVGISK